MSENLIERMLEHVADFIIKIFEPMIREIICEELDRFYKEKVYMDIATIKAKLDANDAAIVDVKTGLDNLGVTIQALRDQIAQGNPVTDAQLQEVADRLDTQGQSLAALKAEEGTESGASA